MRLEISEASEDQVPGFVRGMRVDGAKFVVCYLRNGDGQDGEQDEAQVVILGKAGDGAGVRNHDVLVPEGARFLGAGTVEIRHGGYDVSWGSNSCLRSFTRDRPADDSSERILTEVKKAVGVLLSVERM